VLIKVPVDEELDRGLARLQSTDASEAWNQLGEEGRARLLAWAAKPRTHRCRQVRVEELIRQLALGSPNGATSPSVAESFILGIIFGR
jgi:uncharacterized protein YdeI (YjbR/CyaY-like superfamily)